LQRKVSKLHPLETNLRKKQGSKGGKHTAQSKDRVRLSSENSGMLIGERRQHVLSLIQRDGRVLVSELSESLGISPITIRKDLDYLGSKGLVERTHGGALALQSSALLDPSLKDKEQHQSKEKQLIASAAIKLVSEGQCVLLDSGSTTTAIARNLRQFSHLTVITNGMNIAAELSDTNFDILLIGGSLRKNSFSLVGPLAEDTLREIHADILFLGVDGFDIRIGLTTPNVLEARANRAMVRASKKVVAVCDSTKFHRQSLALIVPPTAIHTIITDSGIQESDVESLKSIGVEVIIV
jgi:DeoR family transcriptional regulator, aga operon transcriptional repressor